MKNYLMGLCAAVGLAVALPVTAQSDEQSAQDRGLFRVRGILAKTHYTLEYEDSTVHRKGTSDFTAKGLGLSYVGARRWFVDLKHTSSSNANHDYWQTFGFASLPLERKETAITAGWATESLFSVFVTYQLGDTVRTNPPTSSEKTRTLETKGIVVGIGKSFPTRIGTFGINGGLGYNKGIVKTTNTNPSLDSSFNADYALAYSFGGSYSYQMHRNIALIIDARQQKMRMDFDAGLTSQFYYEEAIRSFGLNVAFQF